MANSYGGVAATQDGLLTGRDGHSLDDMPDADIVLGMLRDQAHAIPVQMGLGFSPDVVWNGHGVCDFLGLTLMVLG